MKTLSRSKVANLNYTQFQCGWWVLLWFLHFIIEMEWAIFDERHRHRQKQKQNMRIFFVPYLLHCNLSIRRIFICVNVHYQGYVIVKRTSWIASISLIWLPIALHTNPNRKWTKNEATTTTTTKMKKRYKMIIIIKTHSHKPIYKVDLETICSSIYGFEIYIILFVHLALLSTNCFIVSEQSPQTAPLCQHHSTCFLDSAYSYRFVCAVIFFFHSLRDNLLPKKIRNSKFEIRTNERAQQQFMTVHVSIPFHSEVQWCR